MNISLSLEMLAPNRNRALRSVLKQQFLHDVVPSFCGSLSRWERGEGGLTRAPGPDFTAVLCDAVSIVVPGEDPIGLLLLLIACILFGFEDRGEFVPFAGVETDLSAVR